MRKIYFFISLLLLFCIALSAQVSINSDGTQPDPSAGLDVKFSDKGFLLPRLSVSQIKTISIPADGLQVYCTTDSKMYIYVAATLTWKEVAYGSGTISIFPCGSSITINHLVSGGVAPVDKSVTYGTVINIPGEPLKCWITSNLGANHQATSVNDATEESAGWYWQFNRKQGYKHDGSTRTPNTTWITSINENHDWQTGNDPCNIELGTTWRIPTNTEWFNVENSGGWTNWNGPWGSGLKLHAAGYLNYSDGSLLNRGSNGDYCSSTQYDATNEWAMLFDNGNNYVYYYNKTYGFSVRCVRD